jgi:lipoprotein NlpD
MFGAGNQRWMVWVALAMAATLAGCASSRPTQRATVEDRNAARPAPGATDPVKPLPGAENAGKPGYYTVKPGDTIMRIGLETGQAWRDLVRWNNLENPNVIEVGQTLRVTAPTAAQAAAPPAPAASEGVAVARPVTSGTVTPVTPASGTRPAASGAVAVAVAPAPASAPTAPAAASDEDLAWIWPANGALLAGFDEARNKGLDIAGRPGDAVLAAADGRVVYAGAGLRGYGNLVILKHNNTYLTAYAHNQALLVKEDQNVRRGQKIAEMGSSDAERVKLHFEIRKLGKPVDPARLLPPR